jgi:nicotinamidase-related amidase
MNAKRTRPSHGRARAAARLARTAAAVGSTAPLGLRLRAARSLLIVVDVHERLLHTIDQIDRVVGQCAALMKMARSLAVPVLVTEHVPDKLGPTTSALRMLVADSQVLAKRHFCAADEPAIAQRVAAMHRPQVVIAGLEAHVCVLQTALGFAERGYRVHVVADACGSRKETSHAVAMERLRAGQVSVVTAEMVMFEWLEHADRAEMRELIALIK